LAESLLEDAQHDEPGELVDVHHAIDLAVKLRLDDVVKGELEDALPEQDLVTVAQPGPARDRLSVQARPVRGAGVDQVVGVAGRIVLDTAVPPADLGKSWDTQPR